MRNRRAEHRQRAMNPSLRSREFLRLVAVSAPRRARRRRIAGRFAAGTGLLVAALSQNGCVQVPVWNQELVSKPNMTFNDRGPFSYGPRINAQLEPGSADNGGATSAGCTACK